MKSKAKSIIYVVIFLFIVCILTVFLLKNNSTVEEFTREDFSMGSFVSQRIYGGTGEQTMQSIIEAINDTEYNGISYRSESSYVSKINDASGKNYIKCSELVYTTVKSVKKLADFTGGAYNPMLGALNIEWNFDSGEHYVPSEDTILDKLQYCDYNDIFFNDEEQSIMLGLSGNMLDLGGVGKGLACDIAYNILSESDCTGAVIAVGGSICTYGKKPDGSAWKVAVRDPFGASGEYIGTVTLSEKNFISTSGDYEKCFELNGIRYHHILDSKTGYPCEGNLTSVTVVCDSGSMSDALSTACFVMGYEDSLSVLEHYNADALFVFKDGSIKTTDGIQFEKYE